MNDHIHKEWYHQQNWQNQNYSYHQIPKHETENTFYWIT